LKKGYAAMVAASDIIRDAPKAKPTQWRTDLGPLNFEKQNFAEIRGTFPDYRGRLVGEVSDNGDTDGVWMQPKSERRCKRSRYGSRYWGTFIFLAQCAVHSRVNGRIAPTIQALPDSGMVSKAPAIL
jgi:hypothetical protein